MKYRNLLAVAFVIAACGSDDPAEPANSSTANAEPNNANGDTNNATITPSNNATNSASNNMTNGDTNNTTTPGIDFISALVDGTVVVADAAEGGVEPMDPIVQLRKTTGEASVPVQIFRLWVPAVEVTTYDCTNPDVTVTYSELNGQLINNWASSDTCTIDITSVDPLVTGTFTATTSDGATTIELTDGEFRLTP